MKLSLQRVYFTLLLFSFCLLKTGLVNAQVYPLKCFIKIDGNKYERGYLYKMTDSTIQITRKHNDLFKVKDHPELLETIPLDYRLTQIRLRNRFIGVPAGVIGFAAGVTISALAVMQANPELSGAIVGYFVVVPIVSVGLSALAAVAANSTSRVNYKPQISGNAELEALRYYSFVNWLDRKNSRH